ncbi:MAG: 6-hydroxymethylpterin diphosphokinase MptE-like protein, partial [Pseudomonadota bacterium]
AEVIEAGGNLGVAGGRNRLIREAIKRGAHFILSVDDDILLPPDYVEILETEYGALAAEGENPGILTPATLDFHGIAGAIFTRDEIAAIEVGARVETPSTPEVRRLLAARDKRRARDIYHMGIADWRGAYFYSGAPEDRSIQRAYKVEAERRSGADSHLRHAKNAWSWIIEGARPIAIDTAPGGVCFYPASLAEAIGYHDESFNPFGFEDADFALRAREAGYQQFCAPRAIAIHDIAARLSERPLAVLRSTQGKMAGAFVRKHARGHDAAAAFAAMSRRAFEQVTLPEQARREHGAILRTPTRLEALAAYLGNAILYLLPSEIGAPTTKIEILNSAYSFFCAIVPGGETLPVRKTADGFELGEAGGDLSITAACAVEQAGGFELRLAMTNGRISEEFLPPLLAAASGAGALAFDADMTLAFEAGKLVSAKSFGLRASGAVSLSGSAHIRRGVKAEGAVAPLAIESLTCAICDKGSLARVLKLLADVERLSPAAFLKHLEALPGAQSIRSWLRGGATAIELQVSGVIAGAPGPLRLSVACAETGQAEPNPAVAALWTEVAERPTNAEPPALLQGEDRMEQLSMTLKSFVKKFVAEDPCVAPFPETYNPPKSLRLARRARYYSAARGVPLTSNEAKLVSFRNRHRGERAFIIGNGPSLNLVDLTRLKGETTFGVNAIYLNKDKMGFLPTHHIVEDVFVAEDRAAEINALRGPHKWYGHYLRYCLEQTPEVCWLNVACDYRNYPGFPHFSTNAARIVWVGGTVSYIALQLAYHMGFDEVILVGFDHSYSIPREAMVEGRAITSTSDDPNHFHPGYFGKGYRWHDPRVDRMERAYINARRAFDAAGRRVINATAGGRLEVFERADYASLFK